MVGHYTLGVCKHKEIEGESPIKNCDGMHRNFEYEVAGVTSSPCTSSAPMLSEERLGQIPGATLFTLNQSVAPDMYLSADFLNPKV